MKRTILIFALLLSCGPTPSPVTPPPTTEGDSCDQACAAWVHFAKFDDRCLKEASDTKDGKSCNDLCREVEGSGYTTMYPECIPKAKDCMQAKQFSSKGCD